MLEAIEVDGFRGLRRLKVEGLGRVNLIIGRNNSGKTALMEALAAVVSRDPASTFAYIQTLRRPNVDVADFERFWSPLFWNQKSEQELTLSLRMSNGEIRRLGARTIEGLRDVVTTSILQSLAGHETWSIALKIDNGGEEREDIIEATSNGVTFPNVAERRNLGWVWIRPSKEISKLDVQYFSKLKQSGRETQLLDILTQVDSRVSGVELLAPTGTEAELFVRLESGSPLLHVGMMGDGFQRCFEFGVAVLAVEVPVLFIDEFENGLHHGVHEPVWRRLADISHRRGLQIFATTHSEECVQAACRAFTDANDDGLRVIRLDRREEETVATVYDRSLVEAATRMGVEIRG
jgi:energy-coupling factor transporter ATP-binding protein EcfA2